MGLKATKEPSWHRTEGGLDSRRFTKRGHFRNRAARARRPFQRHHSDKYHKTWGCVPFEPRLRPSSTTSYRPRMARKRS